MRKKQFFRTFYHNCSGKRHRMLISEDNKIVCFPDHTKDDLKAEEVAALLAGECNIECLRRLMAWRGKNKIGKNYLWIKNPDINKIRQHVMEQTRRKKAIVSNSNVRVREYYSPIQIKDLSNIKYIRLLRIALYNLHKCNYKRSEESSRIPEHQRIAYQLDIRDSYKATVIRGYKAAAEMYFREFTGYYSKINLNIPVVRLHLAPSWFDRVLKKGPAVVDGMLVLDNFGLQPDGSTLYLLAKQPVRNKYAIKPAKALVTKSGQIKWQKDTPLPTSRPTGTYVVTPGPGIQPSATTPTAPLSKSLMTAS